MKLLLSDKRVNPTGNSNEAVRCASRDGHVKFVKLLMSDNRVDASVENNEAVCMASTNGHVEVMKLLLQDKRVDPSADPIIIRTALRQANTGVLDVLLRDDRIVITNELISIVDRSSARVDALFLGAAQDGIWPRVIGNSVACGSRARGHLRIKLDGLEMQSSWIMLLSIKRIFTSTIAARVGDVLREVCSEWTRYQSQ
jgi:hypothetical protein